MQTKIGTITSTSDSVFLYSCCINWWRRPKWPCHHDNKQINKLSHVYLPLALWRHDHTSSGPQTLTEGISPRSFASPPVSLTTDPGPTAPKPKAYSQGLLSHHTLLVTVCSSRVSHYKSLEFSCRCQSFIFLTNSWISKALFWIFETTWTGRTKK